MKKIINVFALGVLLTASQASASIVEVYNTSPFKIETSFDLVAYPDTKRTQSENSTLREDIGKVLLRGISIGLHIGNTFIDNILSEALSQTLGLGNITYYVFAELKNDGRKNSAGEFVVEFELYLFRLPKSIFYAGGLIDRSQTFKVVTKDFENFRLIKGDREQECSSALFDLISGDVSVGYASSDKR